MSDLLIFARAIAVRSSNAITGGIIGLAWLVYTQLTGRNPPMSAFTTAIAAGVLWSCFAAWREQLLKARAHEEKKPEFYYDANGSLIRSQMRMDPQTNQPFLQLSFRLHFTNKGVIAAYNLTSECHGCWVNDDPPTAHLIDHAPSVGRTAPGESGTIIFQDWHPAIKINGGQLGLTEKNILVLLFDIRFQVAPTGPVCVSSPIWLTWHPGIRDRLGPSRPEEVARADAAIQSLKTRSLA